MDCDLPSLRQIATLASLDLYRMNLPYYDQYLISLTTDESLRC